MGLYIQYITIPKHQELLLRFTIIKLAEFQYSLIFQAKTFD